MQKVILILAIILFSITSCDLLQSGNRLKIEVIDANTWSPEDPVGVGTEGASVMLLDIDNPDKNNPLHETVTNSSGFAEFEEIPDGDYYVYIEKGSLSNLVQQEIKDGTIVGFLISGMFQSQAEVETSIQPGASVGAPKLLDYNGDLNYDVNDKEPGKRISLSHYEEFTCLIAEKILFDN